MIRKMKSLGKLNKKDLFIIIRMFYYLLRAELIFAIFAFSFFRDNIFKKKNIDLPPSKDELSILKKHIALLELVCRNVPWKPSCLRRAIVLRDSLAKVGISANIKIGMRKEKEKFLAHAWLETCGLEIFKNGTYNELLSCEVPKNEKL